MTRLIGWVLNRGSLFALAVGVASSSGCSSTGPDTGVDGIFKLIKFNGLAVPANYVQLPDINGLPTSCFEVISEGRLGLSVATLTYTLSIVYRDSCTQHILESVQTGGRFELSSNTLTLFRGDEVIPTTHVNDVIGIHPSADYFYFQKQ